MMAHLVGLGVALLLLAGTTAAARPLQDHRSDYDYLLLVRQWPGTFCATSHSNNACPLLKHRNWSRFTIHGLWPNRQDGTWPEFCDSEQPFDVDVLDDLRSDMDDEWPSFMDSTSSENFWAHEWNKHGTCAEDNLGSEHDFFKTVLDLNAKWDLKAALDAHGIQPSPDTVYAKADLLAAFKDAFGVDLLLHCSPHNSGLTEVWMCFDKQLQPIDCQVTQQEEQHCQHIKIAPFPSGRSQADPEALQPLQLGTAAIIDVQAGSSAVYKDHDHDHDHDSDDDDDEEDAEQREEEDEQEEEQEREHEEQEEEEERERDEQEKEQEEQEEEEEHHKHHHRGGHRDAATNKNEHGEQDEQDDHHHERHQHRHHDCGEQDDNGGQEEQGPGHHQKHHDHDKPADDGEWDQRDAGHASKDSAATANPATTITETAPSTPAVATASSSGEVDSAVGTSSSNVVVVLHQRQQPRHRVQPPSSIARTVSIALTGAVLVTIILATVVSSWVKRATSHLDDDMTHPHSCVTPQAASASRHMSPPIIPAPATHLGNPSSPDCRSVLILPAAASFDSSAKIQHDSPAAHVDYAEEDQVAALRRPLLDP